MGISIICKGAKKAGMKFWNRQNYLLDRLRKTYDWYIEIPP